MNPYLLTKLPTPSSSYFYKGNILYVPHWPETAPISSIPPEPHIHITWETWSDIGLSSVQALTDIYFGPDQSLESNFRFNMFKYLVVVDNVFQIQENSINIDFKPNGRPKITTIDLKSPLGNKLLLIKDAHGVSDALFPFVYSETTREWLDKLIAEINRAYDEWDPNPWTDDDPPYEMIDYYQSFVGALNTEYGNSELYELPHSGKNITYGVYPRSIISGEKNVAMFTIQGEDKIYFSAHDVVKAASDFEMGGVYAPEFYVKVLDGKVKKVIDRINSSSNF